MVPVSSPDDVRGSPKAGREGFIDHRYPFCGGPFSFGKATVLEQRHTKHTEEVGIDMGEGDLHFSEPTQPVPLASGRP